MGLTALLGLRPTLNGLSLPKYMHALESGELEPPLERNGLASFMPASPPRPTPPKPDPVEAVLAQHREEQKLQDAYDREAMLETVRRKRAAADVPQRNVSVGRDAERRWRAVKRWNEIEQQLGDTNGE